MKERIVVHVSKGSRGFDVRKDDETAATYPRQADAVQAGRKIAAEADLFGLGFSR